MPTFRTLAITLTKRPLREADRLYSFYTREAGKVIALCQGARKTQTKMGGHLEPFGIVDVLIAAGRQFDRVAGAERSFYFQSIAGEIHKARLAGRLFYFLDSIIKPGVSDQRVFCLLEDYLRLVDDLAPSAPSAPAQSVALTLSVYLKLFSFLGHAPEIEKCVVCRKPSDEKEQFFFASRGGLLCSKCAPTPAKRRDGEGPVTASVMELVRFFAAKPLAEILRRETPVKTLRLVGELVISYRDYHFDPLGIK